MIKKLLLLPLVLGLFAANLQAQTIEELKAQKAEKEAQIAALQGEVGALTSQIAAFPGWEFGSLGTLGFNFSQFNDWFLQESPNTQTLSFGFVGNAFANYDEPKYFWNNSGNLNLFWTQLDLDTEDGMDEPTKNTVDALSLTSLFGYKINEKLAASVLGEFRTSLIPVFVDTLNGVSYLDLGAGATWTPIANAVVVFHPLNYNFVFSADELQYTSSLGCKIVADYSRSLPKGIAWKTNLSAFLSYSDVPNFSNWTWVNGFSLTVWKGIGVGIDFGLRGNKQESFNAALADNPDLKIEDLPSDQNPLQSYWLIGLSYKL